MNHVQGLGGAHVVAILLGDEVDECTREGVAHAKTTIFKTGTKVTKGMKL